MECKWRQNNLMQIQWCILDFSRETAASISSKLWSWLFTRSYTPPTYRVEDTGATWGIQTRSSFHCSHVGKQSQANFLSFQVSDSQNSAVIPTGHVLYPPRSSRESLSELQTAMLEEQVLHWASRGERGRWRNRCSYMSWNAISEERKPSQSRKKAKMYA